MTSLAQSIPNADPIDSANIHLRRSHTQELLSSSLSYKSCSEVRNTNFLLPCYVFRAKTLCSFHSYPLRSKPYADCTFCLFSYDPPTGFLVFQAIPMWIQVSQLAGTCLQPRVNKIFKAHGSNGARLIIKARSRHPQQCPLIWTNLSLSTANHILCNECAIFYHIYYHPYIFTIVTCFGYLTIKSFNHLVHHIFSFMHDDLNLSNYMNKLGSMWCILALYV